MPCLELIQAGMWICSFECTHVRLKYPELDVLQGILQHASVTWLQNPGINVFAPLACAIVSLR